MKTVLHITEVLAGGVLPVISNICKGLDTQYRFIVAYNERPDTPKDLSQYFSPGVKLLRLKNLKREISLKDLKAVAEIYRIIREYRPDIIHFHSTKGGAVGRIAALDYKADKFYSPHGYVFFNLNISKRKAFIYRSIEKLLAKTGCVTVACGKDEYKYAKELDSCAVVVENGIDTEMIDKIVKQTEAKKYSFTVYTAGRIWEQKNPKLFNDIAVKLPEISFVWIGDGEDRGVLDSPNIKVTGMLDNKQALRMGMKFDCYISCSMYEGLPLALMEAMYMEKECIVTEVTGNAELIKDGENGSYAESVDSFVEKISEFAKTRNLAHGKNAEKTIQENYTKEIMCAKYAKLYK